MHEVERKLLSELGILTGQTLSQGVAKASLQKLQQDIPTSLGKEVVRDGAGLLQKQALKHLGEDIAREGVKNFGREAAKQA